MLDLIQNIVFYVIYEIGKYGPLILAFISLYLLKNKNFLFFYYTVGIFINAIINLILKGIIQQPRPYEDPKKFELAIKNGHKYTFKDGIPFNLFGMPSGHTQSALFSSTYIYLCTKEKNILYLYLAISFITAIQRVNNKMHSILQVLVGAICGITIGYCFYYMAEHQIKGVIREKPDDNGPL